MSLILLKNEIPWLPLVTHPKVYQHQEICPWFLCEYLLPFPLFTESFKHSLCDGPSYTKVCFIFSFNCSSRQNKGSSNDHYRFFFEKNKKNKKNKKKKTWLLFHFQIFAFLFNTVIQACTQAQDFFFPFLPDNLNNRSSWLIFRLLRRSNNE